jgi:hypothetical protein
MPWRAEDLSTLLATFVEQGTRYGGFGSYTGYNELVADAHTWLTNLPHTIEAMFLVDCTPHQRNTPYSASKTCEQAHRNARAVHTKVLAEYSLSEASFPLLRLSPEDWDAPFSAA